MNQQPTIRELDTFEAGCIRCGGTGWVCENHRNKPWADGPEYYRPWYAFWVKKGCDCGAGSPCPDCNELADQGYREDHGVSHERERFANLHEALSAGDRARRATPLPGRGR